MARPFRLQPPSLPERAVARPRLRALLAQRWDRRLVTVVAGPGFGKTMLLASSLADPPPAGGRDAWLSCEPADESAGHLAAGLATALDLDPGAGIEAVLDAVWSYAPGAVCIVLDDVHEIPADSSGSALLRRLVSDLAANGHLVLASRDKMPVPTARVAASGQLVRLDEPDLVFDGAELAAFAAARSVDPSLLRSTGGWPALAELTASAGADLVLDYLWEEVLARIGPDRARLLARFVVAGGGDDEVVAALAGVPIGVDDLVASVPLVERASTGWAMLHPLWAPALRPLLTGEQAADARRAAAAVHRSRGRLNQAVDLLVEAEDWRTVLDIVRQAETRLSTVEPADFGRWCRALPPRWRQEPEALLATGLELLVRSPLAALPTLEPAAEAFRSKGDVDGELAAISENANVRWWANDGDGIVALYGRVAELAQAGSARAAAMGAVGLAAVAHLAGDSEGVLAALGAHGDDTDPAWHLTARWFRSVAYRRVGDLERAHDELGEASTVPFWRHRAQHEIAQLRIDWLRGDVDHVMARLPEFRGLYESSGERFLAREATLELASKAAWIGELDTARDLLANVGGFDGLDNPLASFLELVTRAALAVGDGDEEAAADLLRDDVLGALGHQERSWFWRDRAVIGLAHVLLPDSRPGWGDEPLGAVHRPGIVLAEALEATREGDLAVVRRMRWPDVGVVRAHLPVRWAVELAAAGVAARNPAPDGLLAAVGPHARTALRSVVSSGGAARVVAAAKQLAAALPTVPLYRLRVGVPGPLEVLARRRVRELLCYLAAHRRARREVVGDDLWPELADPRHNLRVTLNYLQRVLQPDRVEDEPPYFLRSDSTWLALANEDGLEIDAWELDALLDQADAAERAGAPSTALVAYRAALPLWRGEPFADVPYAPWAEAERTRLVLRYSTAAVRAGELLLATGGTDDARAAASRAIAAEPGAEPAYRLLARAHLAEHDRAGARRALEDCLGAVATLDVEPDPATLALLRSVSRSGAASV